MRTVRDILQTYQAPKKWPESPKAGAYFLIKTASEIGELTYCGYARRRLREHAQRIEQEWIRWLRKCPYGTKLRWKYQNGDPMVVESMDALSILDAITQRGRASVHTTGDEVVIHTGG